MADELIKVPSDLTADDAEIISVCLSTIAMILLKEDVEASWGLTTIMNLCTPPQLQALLIKFIGEEGWKLVATSADE